MYIVKETGTVIMFTIVIGKDIVTSLSENASSIPLRTLLILSKSATYIMIPCLTKL